MVQRPQWARRRGSSYHCLLPLRVLLCAHPAIEAFLMYTKGIGTVTWFCPLSSPPYPCRTSCSSPPAPSPCGVCRGAGGAQALVEERRELAQRAVGGEGPARAGADGGEEIVILPLLKLPVPFRRRHAPRGEVQDIAGVIAADVCGGTGPWVAPRLPHHARPHGVALDIRHRVRHVAVVEDARVETVLPKVAASSMEAIHVLSVAVVCAADRFRESVTVRR